MIILHILELKMSLYKTINHTKQQTKAASSHVARLWKKKTERRLKMLQVSQQVANTTYNNCTYA